MFNCLRAITIMAMAFLLPALSFTYQAAPNPVYTDQQWGFSIQYETNWATNKSNPSYIISFTSADRKVMIGIIAVDNEKEVPAKQIHFAVEKTIRKELAIGDNLVAGDDRKVNPVDLKKIDATDGYRGRYRLAQEGMDFTVLITTFTKGRRVYQVMAFIEANLYDCQKKSIDRVVSSFRITQ